MFKAPFSFEGRIRRIEYLLSAIIGGARNRYCLLACVGTAVFRSCQQFRRRFRHWSFNRHRCIGRWYLVHYCTRCKTSA